MPILIHGYDLGLNHGAVVQLKDGKLDWFAYFTDSAGAAARSAAHGMRMKIDSEDRQAKQMARLAWIENWLDKTCLIPHRPDYAGVEDYAIRVEQGAHYMGEVGGIIRILLWFRGIPFRLSDPISVKMFATHDGTAQKDLVEECVKERWGVDFSEYNPPANKNTGKTNRQTSEDLCDAYSVAMLAWTEYRLRQGQITTADLGHEKEIRVFNRVTKTYPTSLLGREWIQNPHGSKEPHGGLRARIEAKIKQLNEKAPGAAKLLKELLKDG